MFKWLNFYTNNKHKIRKYFIFIIFILIIIRIFNNLIYESSDNKGVKSSNIINEQEENNIKKDYKKESISIVSEENVSKKNRKTYGSIVEQFLSNCAQNKVEDAYSLISDQCKDVLFNNDIESFKKDYIDVKFNGDKIYEFNSWISNENYTTYYVKIYEDAIKTGKVQNEYKDDYITIIEENEKIKLNINGYLQTQDGKSYKEQMFKENYEDIN